jgi:hypothetical protein
MKTLKDDESSGQLRARSICVRGFGEFPGDLEPAPRESHCIPRKTLLQKFYGFALTPDGTCRIRSNRFLIEERMIGVLSAEEANV